MLWQPPPDHGDTLGSRGDSLRALVFFLGFSSWVENADVYGLSRGGSGFQASCPALCRRCVLPVSVEVLDVTAEGFVPSSSVPFRNHKNDIPAMAERCPRRASLCSNAGSHGGRNVLSHPKRSSRGHPRSLCLAGDALLILGEIHSALANMASPFPVLLPALTRNPFPSTVEGQSSSQRSSRPSGCPRREPGALPSQGKAPSRVITPKKTWKRLCYHQNLQLAR